VHLIYHDQNAAVSPSICERRVKEGCRYSLSTAESPKEMILLRKVDRRHAFYFLRNISIPPNDRWRGP
jgi:hypothetical protein